MEPEGSIKFIADRNVSPVLVSILKKLKAGFIESLHKKPENEYRDEDWIPTYTARGYVIITPDRKQLREEIVAKALVSYNAKIIFLPRSFADSRAWDQALWLLKYWWRISDRAHDMTEGEFLSFHTNGNYSIVRPEHEKPKRKQKTAKKTKKSATNRSLF